MRFQCYYQHELLYILSTGGYLHITNRFLASILYILYKYLAKNCEFFECLCRVATTRDKKHAVFYSEAQ